MDVRTAKRSGALISGGPWSAAIGARKRCKCLIDKPLEPPNSV